MTQPMLKRNGQLCQHSVPDYPGRLTDDEFLAYNTVFTTVEDEFQQLSGIRDSLDELEASLAKVVGSATNAPSRAETVRGKDGAEWQIIKPLLKPQHSDVLLCKRTVGADTEFAVIERFNPNSPLAKAQGSCEVQMTSHDPKRLVQDFAQSQREMLHLWVHDIVAMARENLEEKFSGQDLSRVVKAIAQRCAKQSSPEETIIPIQQRKRIEGVHV
jgi:hypothetical protein